MKKLKEPAVLNWDRIIHKNVRTSDGEQIGNVASEDADAIVVLADRSREYKIPKLHIAGFDGSQVYLDLPLGELAKYRFK